MKSYPKPKEFSGSKFALRYGLDPMKDFWADEKFIYVPDNLPDDPPIFEPPDPPGPTITSRINALSTGVSPQLKEILLELARGR